MGPVHPTLGRPHLNQKGNLMAAAKKQDKAEEPAKAPKAPQPHEVNSALSSDRMRALLKEHQDMGVRPK